MKSNSFYILTIVISTLLFFSCESAKKTQTNSSNMISKISLEKITMGSNSNLEITKNETINSSMTRNGASDAVSAETSENDWNKINELVSKIDLSQIDEWEGPTQARFYDGARATTIKIETQGQTYNSQSFDEGEPPAQLKELYNYLESLENQ